MANGGEKRDFIDFIIEATKDQNLAEEFLKQTTSEDLYDFFQGKKYHDISAEDCEGILEAVNNGIGKGINQGRHPVEFDGPGTKGY